MAIRYYGIIMIFIIKEKLSLKNMDDTYTIFMFIVFLLLFFTHRKTAILIWIKYHTNFMLLFALILSCLNINPKQYITYSGIQPVILGEKYPTRPTIYVVNYCRNRFEHLILNFLPDNFVIFTSLDVIACVYNKAKYFRRGKSYHHFKFIVKQAIKQNKNVVCFVSAPLSVRLSKLKSGIFNIAMKEKLTITPLCVSKLETDDFEVIKHQKLFMRIGKTFIPEKDGMKVVRDFYLDSFKLFSTI